MQNKDAVSAKLFGATTKRRGAGNAAEMVIVARLLCNVVAETPAAAAVERLDRGN